MFIGGGVGGVGRIGGGLRRGGGSPTPTPTPASGPIVARQSVDFGSRNGILSQLRRLTMPGLGWYFGVSAGPLQPGIISGAAQLDRGAIYGTTPAGDSTKFAGLQVLISAGVGDTAGPIFLGYYGAENADLTRRNRFRCRLINGANTVDMLSAEYLSDQPVTWQVICDGTNFRLDLVLLDGTILTGAAGTIAGTYVGNSATTNLGVGAGQTATGTNVNQAFMGCLSNIVVAGGTGFTLSPAQQQAIARGENPSTVFGSALRRWYRLDGPSDLAMTAGSDIGTTTLTNTSVGTWLPLQTGPSLCGRSDGTSAMSLEIMPHGYVAGVSPLAPTAARPLPLARVFNLAGGSTHFEARAVLASDRTTGWTPWVQVTASPVAAGSSAVIELAGVARSPWLVAEVRRADAPDVRCVGRQCGVGPKIWWDGQSQEEIALKTLSANTALDDAIRPGTSGLVTFVHPPRIYAAAVPMCHRIVMTDQDAGSGLRAFARQWQDRYPNQCVAIVANTRVGTGRPAWYDNIIGSGGVYRSWGDGTTPGSGMVTDLLLISGRDITCFVARYSSDDFTSTPSFATIMNRYFTGADGVARAWNQAANGLVHPIVVYLSEHDRFIATSSSRSAAAVQTQRNTTIQRRIDVRNVIASPPSGVTMILGTSAMDKLLDTVSDEAHQNPSDGRGSPRQMVNTIPVVARIAGLRTFDAAARPSSATISGGDILVSFSLPNGGTVRTNASASVGATVRGFWVNTGGGFVEVTGTLETGNQVRLAGPYSAGTLVAYARGGPINLVVPTEAATVADAFATESTRIDDLLVVTDADLTGLSYAAGVPMLATAADLVAA